ncbi:methyltransferase domain-containing protein [Nocardia sp. NPDC050710]|uniref:class I SAM-dependent methyltransferase n=1 Tax=Nocardia sp. NPDC050710 TaxID=3157220 RepID=UPI0033D901D5
MSAHTPSAALDSEFGTRPGTPMIGPFSVNQMDDFYAALARGEVKETGVMNYLQRLFIAERLRPGERVVDVCCGRGLQLPPLFRYRPDLGGYAGLDISATNLDEARDRVAELEVTYPQVRLPIEFHEIDVSQPWPALAPADVAVYTSALEHLPRELAIASLQHTLAALAPAGVLYLSTPNTPGSPPRRLQHRVHVYEWSHEELLAVLEEIGAEVRQIVGILPPQTSKDTEAAVLRRFGPGAADFYRDMAAHTPAAMLGPVVATALDTAASEVLYVCVRRDR